MWQIDEHFVIQWNLREDSSENYWDACNKMPEVMIGEGDWHLHEEKHSSNGARQQTCAV